ncbi:MAG: hypothetical protein PF439_03720 [Helicobacteraceae bacterium]|jgi:hypothetical protein|nr:hypothetical protein [Helicobacteraceae bacterium]
MQHVVSQLITKKEELIGELKHYKEKVYKLEESVCAIYSSILLFDPKYNVRAIKAKRFTSKPNYFKTGESHTLVLDTLRRSKEPLSTNQITLQIMQVKIFDIKDKELVVNIQKTLSKTINNQERNKLIRRTHSDASRNIYWEILA